MTGLCTLAELRAWRGATDPNATTALDEVFKVFILATSRHFEKICHRELALTAVTEYFDGNNSQQRYMEKPNQYVPVVTPPAVVLFTVLEGAPFTETVIAAIAYRVFDTGLLLYPNGFECPVSKYNYRVNYTYGFDCADWETNEIGGSVVFGVPNDLRKAVCMQTALNLKKASGRYGDSRLGLLAKTANIESETIESYITGIEPEALNMIQQYIKVMY